MLTCSPALPLLAGGVCTEECRNTERRKNGWRLRPGRPYPGDLNPRTKVGRKSVITENRIGCAGGL